MFLRKILPFIFIGILSVFFISCEVINPDETIPSYIHIDTIGITTQENPEYGSSSHKITDAWVYADDQLVGAFELPVTFPVLLSGVHKITIRPGIKVNGISGTRAIYPFYKPYSKDINLIKDSAITIDTTLTYNSYTVFEWIEDFEEGGISLDSTTFSETKIEKTSDPAKVFEGNYSGIVRLDNDHDFFRGKTLESYVLPKGDNPVFLEMNYKTDAEIMVGLYANSTAQVQRLEVLIINKSETWKKIYINLKNAISRAGSVDDFQVFFECQKSSEVSNAEILFDNIKLLHN